MNRQCKGRWGHDLRVGPRLWKTRPGLRLDFGTDLLWGFWEHQVLAEGWPSVMGHLWVVCGWLLSGLGTWENGAAIYRHCESRLGGEGGEVTLERVEVGYLGAHLRERPSGSSGEGWGSQGISGNCSQTNNRRRVGTQWRVLVRQSSEGIQGQNHDTCEGEREETMRR